MTTCKTLLPLTMASLLSACGGGQGSNLDNPVQSSLNNTYAVTSSSSSSSSNSANIYVLNAEGFWQGNAINTSRTISSLILDSTYYWILYSSAGNPNQIGGVIVGNTLSRDGIFNSNNSNDFNFEIGASFPVSWVGSYVNRSNLQGTLTYETPGSIVNLTASYDNNYSQPVKLAQLQGSYSGTSATLLRGRQSTTLTIYATGQVSGSREDGCTFTGNVSPRPRGNAYGININYNGNCIESNASAHLNYSNGSAYFDPNTRQLYSVTLNGTAQDVLAFVGRKL